MALDVQQVNTNHETIIILSQPFILYEYLKVICISCFKAITRSNCSLIMWLTLVDSSGYYELSSCDTLHNLSTVTVLAEIMCTAVADIKRREGDEGVIQGVLPFGIAWRGAQSNWFNFWIYIYWIWIDMVYPIKPLNILSIQNNIYCQNN